MPHSGIWSWVYSVFATNPVVCIYIYIYIRYSSNFRTIMVRTSDVPVFRANTAIWILLFLGALEEFLYLEHCFWDNWQIMGCTMLEYVFGHMQSWKAQISLHIGTVWYRPLLSTNIIIGYSRMSKRRANPYTRLCGSMGCIWTHSSR